MTSQRAEPTRVPPEVTEQLGELLGLLDETDAFWERLPDDLKQGVPKEREREQLIMALAVLPPPTRARIRFCWAWLAEHVGVVSPPD